MFLGILDVLQKILYLSERQQASLDDMFFYLSHETESQRCSSGQLFLSHPHTHDRFRPLDKSAFQKINFLISHPKHMLWVLKKKRLNETVLLSTQGIC